MKKRIVKEKYRQPATSSVRVPGTLRIFNETAVRVPRTAMTAIYADLLQKTCSLTVVCIGDAFSRKLHNAYLGKDTPANVLTFPPNDDHVAEMYINATMAKNMAKKHHISVRRQFLFFYIHGMLHLLGHSHGADMEILEDRYITMYT